MENLSVIQPKPTLKFTRFISLNFIIVFWGVLSLTPGVQSKSLSE